jgi:hypothetical protein
MNSHWPFLPGALHSRKMVDERGIRLVSYQKPGHAIRTAAAAMPAPDDVRWK